MRSLFSLRSFDLGKNVIFFGVDMSSAVYTDNKKKDIINYSKDPMQGLDDTTSTVEAQYISLIFQDEIESFVSVFIIMEPICF